MHVRAYNVLDNIRSFGHISIVKYSVLITFFLNFLVSQKKVLNLPMLINKIL